MENENTETGVRKHLSDKQAWLRLLYMVLFGIAFEVAKFVTFFVAAVQILFKLFTGDVQPRLSGFGASLAVFLRQTVDFMTFRSEVRPYPWSAWPLPEAAAAAAAATVEVALSAKPAGPRTSRGGRRKASGPAADEPKTE
ncbi:MAG: DUF4389 domain-containing protein [Rhodospirillales bacterium]|nr:DUF4389 domain-containing protein [Rhodospirillales bacterium]